MIITGTDVKFHAQQIARSTQVKPAVQRTRDFASSARPANGMAILAASLAVRAAFKAHATKVREHAIAAARTDGGETRVSINAQQVQKVAATARMVNQSAVCQVLSRAWRMMAQEFASLAQRTAKTEFVITMVLAVKAASWDILETRVSKNVNKLVMGHAMLEQLARKMGIAQLA
jgi:hypothetical protein